MLNKFKDSNKYTTMTSYVYCKLSTLQYIYLVLFLVDFGQVFACCVVSDKRKEWL